MTIPTIFETSRPREDVRKGAIAEADFAADLAQVVAGQGGAEHLDPARFFARTYPTRGLKDLLANVGRRLTGAGGEAAAIFRLDTSYGGGKTHGLIALVHAARGRPAPWKGSCRDAPRPRWSWQKDRRRWLNQHRAPRRQAQPMLCGSGTRTGMGGLPAGRHASMVSRRCVGSIRPTSSCGTGMQTGLSANERRADAGQEEHYL